MRNEKWMFVARSAHRMAPLMGTYQDPGNMALTLPARKSMLSTYILLMLMSMLMLMLMLMLTLMAIYQDFDIVLNCQTAMNQFPMV